MLVCYELGKTEEEVRQWTLVDLYRWVAFFRLKNEAEKKAYEDARRNAGRGGNSSMGGSNVIIE